MSNKPIRFGIGFATGRKNFKKVLNSYIFNWKESPAAQRENVTLSLFVAYDLDYSGTSSTDYTNLTQEAVDELEEIVFLGAKAVKKTSDSLIENGMLTPREAKLMFGTGYAAKRNTILYSAIQNQMDYLLFLDDDEYPVAVTNNHGTALWSGQYVLPQHLAYIQDADITNGYHCGYISPIPQINYDEKLQKQTFRRFIEAISNEVVTWDSVERIMANGGVTYADTTILTQQQLQSVPLENSCKFITGGNLCINLTQPLRTFPFYNPPGARGEDTFLSTLLAQRNVLRIPCYAFHDGFSAYKHLLDGVLPTQLSAIAGKSNSITTRFYNACVGWVRYKPLLMYLTQPHLFEQQTQQIREDLQATLPMVSAYFNKPEFNTILDEFNKYVKNVKSHAKNFNLAQQVWAKLMADENLYI